MSKACETILKVMEMVRKGKNPELAWKTALEMMGWKGKSCAQAAFLGLCSEGMILGCGKGNYSRGIKNKEYAIRGLKYLMEHPQKADLTPNELWVRAKVRKESSKQTGYQMDIAPALFRKTQLEIEKK